MTDTIKTVDNSEAMFQAKVIQLAKANGWMVFHPRKSQDRTGRWLTALAGDAGFPDLVLAHPKRGLVFAELKSARGVLSQAQKQWLYALSQHGEVYMWQPKDLQAIADRLGRQP